MKNKLRTLPVTLQNLLIYRVALAILALGAPSHWLFSCMMFILHCRA